MMTLTIIKRSLPFVVCVSVFVVDTFVAVVDSEVIKGCLPFVISAVVNAFIVVVLSGEFVIVIALHGVISTEPVEKWCISECNHHRSKLLQNSYKVMPLNEQWLEQLSLEFIALCGVKHEQTKIGVINYIQNIFLVQ